MSAVPKHSDAQAPVALITGSAARIGAALLRKLHGEGFNIILHYLNSGTKAEALAAQMNAQRPDSVRILKANLLVTSEVIALAQNALAQWQRMDVLINNASAFYPSPLDTLEEDDWINLMRSNAKAPLFLCRELAPALTQTNGCIINIVDSTAMFGLSGFSPYTMAKAALANMTHSLAKELAPRVRVNGIHPGIILWPDYDNGPDETERQAAVEKTALKRMGGVDDITSTASFLIHKASYITGQIIRVDGGAALST